MNTKEATGIQKRLPWLIFASCLAFYMIFWSGHQYSIDGVVMFQYAKTILFQHSLVMDPPVVLGGTEFSVPQWSIGMSLAYVLPLTILSRTAFIHDPSIRQIPYRPELLYNPELVDNSAYRYSSLLNPVVTAASASLVYALCLELGLSRRRAAAGALIFGLASPAAVYSKFDFAQPLSSMLLLAAFFFLLRALLRRHLVDQALAGICLGLAVLVRSEYVLLAPAFLLSLCLAQPSHEAAPLPRARPWEQGAVTLPTGNKMGRGDLPRSVLAFSLPLFALVALNQAIAYLKFGSWLSSGYKIGTLIDLEAIHYLKALLGNLVSPGRGILFFFPVGIGAALGARRLLRTNRPFALALLSSISILLFLYPVWRLWDAGTSWGPRFFVPVFPYLCVLAVLALPQSPRLRSTLAFGLLTLLGAIATLQGLLFNFLDFYNALPLTYEQRRQGFYHFSFANSPIFSGWSGLAHPAGYDIRWLNSGGASHHAVVLAVVGFLGLAVSLVCWVIFFRTSARSDSAYSLEPKAQST